MTAPAVTAPAVDFGAFEGYANTWALDRQGDRTTPGAFAAVSQAINAGMVSIPVIATGAGHDYADPAKVIGRVVAAHEDATGWWISAILTGDPTAQMIRGKLVAGAQLGLSIGGAVRESRPIPGGRLLTDLDVAHVLVTPTPANSGSFVRVAKGGPVLTPAAARPTEVISETELIERERRRRDPGVARRRAEDQDIVNALPFPWLLDDPELRSVALQGLQRAALAKSAAAVAGDPVRAARKVRQAQANTYSSALAAWNDEHRNHRRCRTGGGCDV